MMAKYYRDKANPLAPHRVPLDGLMLKFGENGLLEATDEQIAAMTAYPLRLQRFVEVDPPKPPTPAEPEQKTAEPDAVPTEEVQTDAEADESEESPRRRRRRGTTE